MPQEDIVRLTSKSSHVLKVFKTGLLLMAYIYAIDRQLTDDVAVRRNIAKGTSRVRIWERSSRSSVR